MKPNSIPVLRGWPLLQVPDGRGELHYRSPEAGIREMIRVILLTRPGEQLMRPHFGAGLALFLGEPNTIETRRRIHDRVRESLAKWEPRIQVERVDVDEIASEPGQVSVDIVYRVRRTGVAETLGLTLELGN